MEHGNCYVGQENDEEQWRKGVFINTLVGGGWKSLSLGHQKFSDPPILRV